MSRFRVITIYYQSQSGQTIISGNAEQLAEIQRSFRLAQSLRIAQNISMDYTTNKVPVESVD